MQVLRNLSRALMPLLLLCACAQQDRDAAISPPIAATDQDDETWATELAEHREEIDEELRTSNTSAMAGTQYLKSEPGDRVYLNRQERTFGLADSAGPETVLLVTREEGAWHWHDHGQDVVCRVENELVQTGDALEGAATFENGDFFLSFYPSADRITFIVFDPDEIEMLTSRDLKKTFYRYATIRFRLDGKDQELRAFNPLCNYSPAYNCAIPPRENHLEVAIRAGEMTYPH